jgi:hypothetical protein
MRRLAAAAPAGWQPALPPFALCMSKAHPGRRLTAEWRPGEHNPRMICRLVVVAALLGAASVNAATVGGAIPVPLPLFPGNNWWNIDVSNAPADPSSAGYIGFIGTAKSLHPDFGGDDMGNPGYVYGFPFITVDGLQTKKSVTFGYSDQSDGVDHTTDLPFPFYPIPDEAITSGGWIEAGPPGNIDLRADSDRHILIVDSTNNYLYELYNVWFNGTAWVGGSGAFYDMSTNNRRPEGWTSADAAGLAILPGLVRYDEVYGPNEIGHAFRFTVRATNGHVYPASHTAGSTTGALPMGARLRLKAGTDISVYPAEMQKIFRAFKKYGLIVADNGSDLYISGTYDTRWNNDVLNPGFGGLKASDFEVVQLGWQPPATFLFSVPPVSGLGDPVTVTVTAFDTSDNVATGYGGTVHFTSSDGAATLPVDYAFIPADSGTHTFTSGVVLRTTGGQTITATDVSNATITSTRSVVVGPPAPTNLTAAAAGARQVNLAWTASAGALHYEVIRASASTPYASIATTESPSYTDNSVSGGATYVYRVRAIDSSSRTSGYGTPDAATTLFFTDDPLVAGTTVVKAVHLTELRQAVNAFRAAAGLPAASFTDPALTSTAIRAVHVEELRSALASARAALGLPTTALTDSILTAGATTIKAAHVQELRDAVK